jgi:cell division protein FtsW
MAQMLKTDWILFITVLVMVLFGLLMVYSASSVMAQLQYGSTWHFAWRQGIWAMGGVAALMALKRMPYRRLQSPVVAFGGMGLVILLLALVYVLDSHHRWLRLGGPVGLQPSELAKPALVIFLAYFAAWRARAINDRHTLAPAALATGLLLLAVVKPDLGTAVVLASTAAVVFFVAGLDWRTCAIGVVVAAVLLVLFVAVEPYRTARVAKFFDPDFKKIMRIDPQGRIRDWVEKSLVTRDTNYQLEQSQIAVGAGGPAGLGPMNGKQKLLYLPKAHNDFIYAVVAEEWGLLGSVGLLMGFLFILWRGLRATLRMRDDFGRYLALGVTAMVVIQGLLNMSVVLGMIPTKGIPLPLISYGGSSLVCTLASLGILMNVSEHAG